MRLGIVIPARDEAETLPLLLADLQCLRAPDVEIIVVDGGSTDRSVALTEPLADRVIVAPRGRARQMNAGAAIASGDILLFLHADTVLPATAGQLVVNSIEGGAVWG
ncbi:MAG: glycosyltransferase, partial [Pseudomonadales bacterium]